MTESQVTRRLAAVLAADVAGYSRLMEADEKATIATLDAYRLIFREHIEADRGRIVDTAGDSVLAVFETATGAVRAAIAIQERLQAANQPLPEDQRMQFRIGVNLGEIVGKPDGTIYGAGVNIAARLESLAAPGGVTISGAAFDQVEGKLAATFDFIGEQQVKNIERPVRAYHLRGEGSARPTAARSGLGRRRPLLIGLVALVAIGVAAWLQGGFGDREKSPAPETSVARPSLPDKPSIAVLPFKNLGGGSEQDYFAQGITEDIITDLSKISGLFVISRYSSFGVVERFGGGDGEGLHEMARATAAATALNVRHILQGSVRRSDEQVRITVQLLDAETGRHIWAERYDRDVSDIFAVQDEIAEKVVAALKVRLVEGERQRMVRKYTDNMQAYDLFLRARRLQGGVTGGTNAEARALIEQAIALDADFAAAHAELSWIHMQAYYYQWTDDLERSVRQAVDMAERAVALDDTLAAAHARLGWAYLGTRRFDEAVAAGRRALVLDPNYGDGYLILSEILIYAGAAEEGIRVARQGIPLDPYLSYHHLLHIANGYVVLGDHDRAIETAKRAIEHNPDWPGGYIWLAAIYGQRGPPGEAGRMFAEVLRQTPNFSIEARRRMFAYRDRSIADWMIGGLHKASANAAAESG